MHAHVNRSAYVCTTCAGHVSSRILISSMHVCGGGAHMVCLVRCECQIECDHFLLVRKLHMCQTKTHVESRIHFPYLLLCTWTEIHCTYVLWYVHISMETRIVK